VRTLRALALILGIFAVITIISAAQSESDPREVVQASEILEKIERGVPVNYADKIIEGDININDLKLPEVRTGRNSDKRPNREKYFMEENRLSENLKEIRSPLIFQGCLINGSMNFSNALMLGTVSFLDCKIIRNANFRGSHFNQSIDFSGSQFNQTAYFIDSQFNRTAYFIDSQFNRTAYFSDSLFNQAANFRNSQFKNLNSH
jgi:hypothetical protein